MERGLCAVYAAVSAVQRRDGLAPFTQPSVPSSDVHAESSLLFGVRLWASQVARW